MGDVGSFFAVSTRSASTLPVQVHLAYPRPEDVPEDGRRSFLGQRSEERLTRARELAELNWQALGIEPRWLGMESSESAAAVDPSVFHNRGADELTRFLDGASARDEMAVLVAMIGNRHDETGYRSLFGGSEDSSLLLPGAKGHIIGARLPAGAQAHLVEGLMDVDRDLALRLKNRGTDAPWWELSLNGNVLAGMMGQSGRSEPEGALEPILVDNLGKPVAAVWRPPSGNQRWYLIPAATAWLTVLDWLVQCALPSLAPAVMKRARSPLALDDALQTPAERNAAKALSELEAEYVRERERLEGELATARAAAEPLRQGLLFGKGRALDEAVAQVLESAGFTCTLVDDLLGQPGSADLLAELGGDRVLVEVKSESGNASESLVGSLERHLQTWDQLLPGRPVTSGALIVNHQHRLEPAERTEEVFTRREFAASVPHPVIPTRRLFEWWRESDWEAIRAAVLGNTAAARPRG